MTRRGHSTVISHSSRIWLASIAPYTSNNALRAPKPNEQSFADDEVNYEDVAHEDHKVAEWSVPKVHCIASQQAPKVQGTILSFVVTSTFDAQICQSLAQET